MLGAYEKTFPNLQARQGFTELANTRRIPSAEGTGTVGSISSSARDSSEELGYGPNLKAQGYGIKLLALIRLTLSFLKN